MSTFFSPLKLSLFCLFLLYFQSGFSQTTWVYLYETTCNKNLIGHNSIWIGDSIFQTFISLETGAPYEGLRAYYPMDLKDEWIEDLSGYYQSSITDLDIEVTSAANQCGNLNRAVAFSQEEKSSLTLPTGHVPFNTNEMTISLWFNKTNDFIENEIE